jgi:hypothetical protein
MNAEGGLGASKRTAAELTVLNRSPLKWLGPCKAGEWHASFESMTGTTSSGVP